MPPIRPAHGGFSAPGAGRAPHRRKGKIGLQTDQNRKSTALNGILSLARMGHMEHLSTVAEWMEDCIPQSLLVGASQESQRGRKRDEGKASASFSGVKSLAA